MFAIIETGGKQYKVVQGGVLKCEVLPGEVGDAVIFDRVLAVKSEGGDIAVGSPVVSGAKVVAVIKSQERDKKIIVFKKQRRQHYRRKNGHRQYVTYLTINEIMVA
jgi:large subunit ribosomal protein L21